MQNTSPVLNSPSPTENMIFKTIDFVEILGMTHVAEGRDGTGWCGGCLVCVIMTHCVRKSICNSPLICRKFETIFSSTPCVVKITGYVKP